MSVVSVKMSVMSVRLLIVNETVVFVSFFTMCVCALIGVTVLLNWSVSNASCVGVCVF